MVLEKTAHTATILKINLNENQLLLYHLDFGQSLEGERNSFPSHFSHCDTVIMTMNLTALSIIVRYAEAMLKAQSCFRVETSFERQNSWTFQELSRT